MNPIKTKIGNDEFFDFWGSIGNGDPWAAANAALNDSEAGSTLDIFM